MNVSAEQLNQLVHDAVVHVTAPRIRDLRPVPVATLELVATTGRLAADAGLSERWRWRGHEAARHTASYLTWLQPPEGWRRLDAGELGDFPCRLAWSDDISVFADVLATVGRGARVWTRHGSGSPRRLVRAGRQCFGDRFAGVRVAATAAPAKSLRVTDPTGPPAPLRASAWWFHAPPLDAVALVAAAAGEVRS